MGMQTLYLMLLQFPVQNVGSFFMNVLEGDVLSQSHLCSVKPGSDHSQRPGQRFVQMNVPVQQLQLTPSERKILTKKNYSGRSCSKHRAPVCSQATVLQQQIIPL